MKCKKYQNKIISPTIHNLPLNDLQDCSPFAAAWHKDKDAISSLFYNLTSGELQTKLKKENHKAKDIFANNYSKQTFSHIPSI